MNGSRFALLLISLLAVLNRGAPATDWPQFRGPGGMGVSSEAAPVKWSATENVLWKIEPPGRGTSSPIIVGDRIILACYTGSANQLKQEVASLNRADGKVVWRTPIETRLPEQASIREEHGYASSTPAADADAIYAFFGKSGVFALDHKGKQLWHADVGDGLNGWGSATSPVVWKDLVFVNASVESSSLVALNRKTGKEVWRATGIKESWNTPVLVPLPGGRVELIVAIMGKVLGFDPATGKQLWSCDTDIKWYMAPSLVAADGVVYCVGGRSGGALAVRAGGSGEVTSSHRVWTGKKGSNVTSPVFHDGHLYWMHENQGVAYCASAKSGEIVYEESLERAGQVYASPVLAAGKIYYLARGTGRTYVVAAKPKFEQFAANDLERGIYNASPAVADGRLYVRSDKFLYCIGAK